LETDLRASFARRLEQENEKAPLPVAAYSFPARAFAEREARKADLID
jgi:hypothetical protein